MTQHHPPDINDLGLQADLGMWGLKAIDRRKALKLGLVSLSAYLVGCGQGNTGGNGNACQNPIPKETEGPFPGDGSNGPNALSLVRSDIRSSLTTGKIAPGIPTTLELTLVNTADNCAPLIGHAIYAWHCTADGLYSMYSPGVTSEDFLRGVQATDKNGKATFKTIFPGCYAGRWPHVHFEIYPSLEKATSAANIVRTSQLALPEDTCKTVYVNAAYGNSGGNLSRLSLASDGIFRDGVNLQMATVTGDSSNGYTATLTVGI